MVTHRGIKVNPEKIQAFRDVKEPEMFLNIQKLNERLAVVSRFLSRGGERLFPFLKLLSGVSSMKKETVKKKRIWDQDCKHDFHI